MLRVSMHWPWQAKNLLSDPPEPISQPDHQSAFVGGFSPELLALNAMLDTHHHLLVPTPSPIGHQSESRTSTQAEVKASPVSCLNQISMPIVMACPSGWQAILADAVHPQVPETRYPNETCSCSSLFTIPP